MTTVNFLKYVYDAVGKSNSRAVAVSQGTQGKKKYSICLQIFQER